MVICRKNGLEDAQIDSAASDAGSARSSGPIFLPPRRPSRLARELLETMTLDGGEATPYDEIGFAGRPST